jgi:hypothetical protein
MLFLLYIAFINFIFETSGTIEETTKLKDYFLNPQLNLHIIIELLNS